MKTKPMLKTAVRTVQDLTSDNSQRSRVSKLETIKIQDSLSVLGIKNPALDLYEIIDAYNYSMMKLSPLNRDIYPSTKDALSASEIDEKRKAVVGAYRILAQNYKSPQSAPREIESSSTQLVVPNSGGISAYDVYLILFNRLNERINSVIPEDFGVSLEKVVPFQIPKFNKTYYNPQIKKLKAMRERGFNEQTLPGAKVMEDFEGTLEKLFIPHHLGKFVPCSELTNEFFENVFYSIKDDNWFKKVNKGDIYAGLKIDNDSELFTPYLIGKMLQGPVPKTEKELMKNMGSLVYEKVFGFRPPTNNELRNFLKRIHKINTGNYGLESVSKKQLKYPLTEEVFEIYCAAEDSELFKEPNELEFLVLREVVDPILNGKILGGLNLPVCWWV